MGQDEKNARAGKQKCSLPPPPTHLVDLAQKGVHGERGGQVDDRTRVHEPDKEVQQLVAPAATADVLGADARRREEGGDVAPQVLLAGVGVNVEDIARRDGGSDLMLGGRQGGRGAARKKQRSGVKIKLSAASGKLEGA